MAEIIADTMFDGKIIRLDMSEYMERHTVSKLVGSPPGYVGYHEGGLLTNFVRENPYCVILLDEFEKAHDDVHNVMLSVLDAGKLDDMTSGTVRFCNTLVIMTGNVGTETLLSKRDYNVGFNSEKIDKNSAVMNEMKKRITPALMDRVNEVIIFNKLSKQDLHIIIDMEISKLKSPGSPDVSVTDTAKEALLSDWETGEGARSVRRKVIANILPVVVEYDCSTKEDKVFLVDHDGSRFFVREVRDRSLT
jgi:ATP-dependent Clp protease ATP-binding subunit ClpC